MNKHADGVPNGYAANNRTKEMQRWKARGDGLSEKQKSVLLTEAERKRNERHRQEQERLAERQWRRAGATRMV
jgi:phage/plasmid primase-like uncharacterized protein